MTIMLPVALLLLLPTALHPSLHPSAVPSGLTNGNADVVRFGADPSGREASDQGINAAIAAVNANGGHAVLLFPPGQYKVLAPLSPLVGHDVTVLGHGAHVQWMSTTHYQPMLSVAAVSSRTVTLQGDLLRGADSVNLTSVPDGGIVDSRRTLLRLNSSEVFYHITTDSTRNNRKGELLTFSSLVSGPGGDLQAFIHGKGPLFGYAKVNTTATAIEPSTNIKVLGLAVTGQGAIHETTAMTFDGVQGLSVSGVFLDAVNVGIAFSSSHRVSITANTFSRIDMIGLGYSVVIGTFNLDVDVSGNVGDKGRHFVTTGGEDGISRGITISGNTFRGSILGAISPHAQGYDIAITGNHISDSWIGVETRAPNTVISGNTISNWGHPNASTVVGPMRMQIGIYATEYGSTNTVVKDNTLLYDTARWGGEVAGQPLYGFAICITGLPDSAGRVEFENAFVVVSGNTIAPLPSGGGIGVGLAVDAVGQPIPGGPASGFFPKTLHVQHNVILAPSEYAALTVSGSRVRTDAVVSHNTFGGGQKAATDNDTCLKPWLFYCQGRERVGQLVASSLRQLVVSGNTLGAAAAPTMIFDAIDTLRVVDNTLGGGGCSVPLVSNVTDLAVQSSGEGCPTPLTIPVPRVSSGGGSQRAMELTVWGDGGVFARAVLAAGSRDVKLHHVVPPQGVSVAVASGGGLATLDVTGQFAAGGSLSFSAVPMKHDDHNEVL